MPSTASSTAPPAEKTAQPLHVAQVNDALLKIKTVRDLTGLSESSIYRKIAAGQFVAPIRMGTRCTRFRAGDVMAWLRAQAAQGAHQ